MKILIVKTAPGEIIIKKSVYNHQEVGIAKALIRKGHQCDIMCCADKQASTQYIDVGNGKKITLYCIKGITILKNCWYRHVDDIFAQYDILSLSEYNQIFTWHIAKKYKDKMVIWHGPYYCAFNKRYNAMAKVFDMFLAERYRRLNTMVLTKSVLATKYMEDKHIYNVRTIGVGIDKEMLIDTENRHLDFVDQIAAAEGKKLLYIGRLEPRRNSYFLLDVLKKCLDHGEIVSLVVVGKGEKAYVDEFFKRIVDMGLQDSVIYCESVEQKFMSQLYASVDIFLLPTIYDIFGMVLLEAMYFSKPVITTQNGGSSMLMKNGINGFVIDQFNADEWQKKIAFLLQHTLEASLIGKNAYQKISTEYTWDNLVNKLLCAYYEKIKIN